jgi:zinc D-Ala-D-Ala carboxypeptidase
MEISKHVTFKEVCRSARASKLGIKNEPNEAQLANIRRLCVNLVDPLREWKGEPITVNSCFRSAELNKRTPGSSKTSQHNADNGAAIDLDDVIGKVTNAQMFDYIVKNLMFDQIIWEYGNDTNPDWVHVSLKATGNRKQVLRCILENGKPKYINFKR